MNRYFKTAVLVTAVLVMIMLLAACDGTSPGIDPVETSATTTDTSSPANTSIPADTSGSSDTPDTVTFTKGETTEYVIVIGKNAAAAEKDAADKLSRAFKTYLDIDIKTTIDLVNEALGYREIPTEIVVGKTSRGNACGWDASQYRNNDYFIGVKDGKIYITGATADATMNGVSAFIRKNLFGVGESLTVSSESNLCFTDDYAIKSITLEGQEMKHMSVAYTGQIGLVRQAASVLAEKLTQSYGYTVSVAPGIQGDIILTTPADTPDCASLLGDREAVLGVVNGQVMLAARNAGQLLSAAYNLCDILSSLGSVALEPGKIACEYTPDDSIRVMSFNILGTTDIDKRRAAVMWVIAGNCPDVFGIQEGKDEWLNYFSDGFGDIYSCVGKGTSEKGYTATYDNIYYRTDRFELVRSDTIWLSDTTDVPGSKFEESKRVRIATYAVLRDKLGGAELLFVNTHLDNASAVARDKQARVLLELLAGYEGAKIVTGDFNSGTTSDVYKAMTAALSDARAVAADSDTAPTYNRLGSGTGTFLDYIFISDKVDALSFRVATSLYGGSVYPSDHNAIVANLRIKNK